MDHLGANDPNDRFVENRMNTGHLHAHFQDETLHRQHTSGYTASASRLIPSSPQKADGLVTSPSADHQDFLAFPSVAADLSLESESNRMHGSLEPSISTGLTPTPPASSLLGHSSHSPQQVSASLPAAMLLSMPMTGDTSTAPSPPIDSSAIGGGPNTAETLRTTIKRSTSETLQWHHSTNAPRPPQVPNPQSLLHVLGSPNATIRAAAAARKAASGVVDDSRPLTTSSSSASATASPDLTKNAFYRNMYQPRQRGQGASYGRNYGTGGGASPATTGGGTMATSVPESKFSEFDVVYDDGIRKQRTFSLTTEGFNEIYNEDEEDEEYDYEDHDDELEAAYNEHYDAEAAEEEESDDGQELRPLLDHQPAGASSYSATVIPGLNQRSFATGGRSAQPPGPLNGNNTFDGIGTNRKKRRHAPPNHNGSLSPSASRVILSGRMAQVAARCREFELTKNQKHIIKSLLVYILGCSISFIPYFHPIIGASGHLVATSAVFFTPAATMGRMAEAIRNSLSGIFFAVFVSLASMTTAIWLDRMGYYVLGHIVSVCIFGGGSTFILAYAKAHYNRPTVNQACALAHMLIMIIIVKEGALQLREFSTTRIFNMSRAMLLGVFISSVVCACLWPESAHKKLRSDIAASLNSFRTLLKVLTKTFLLEPNTSPFRSESVQKLVASHVLSFTALAKALEEAQLEFLDKDIEVYEQCVKSLNTLAQYLNGLRSSCGLEYDLLQRDPPKDWNANVDVAAVHSDLQGISEEEANAQFGAGMGTLGDAGVHWRPSHNTFHGRAATGPNRRQSHGSVGSEPPMSEDQTASEELIEFLDHIGKPLKSLALTSKLTIEHLQNLFLASNGDIEHWSTQKHPVTTGKYYFSGEGATGNHPRVAGHGLQSENPFADPTVVRPASNLEDLTPGQRQTSQAHQQQHGGPTLTQMQLNLAMALEVFEKANAKALRRFYYRQNIQRHRHHVVATPDGASVEENDYLEAMGPRLPPNANRSSSMPTRPSISRRPSQQHERDISAKSSGSQIGATSAAVGEQIFLVYFFVFNLMEFVKELAHFVTCVETLVGHDEGLPYWIRENRMTWWQYCWFLITGRPRDLKRPSPSRATSTVDNSPLGSSSAASTMNSDTADLESANMAAAASVRDTESGPTDGGARYASSSARRWTLFGTVRTAFQIRRFTSTLSNTRPTNSKGKRLIPEPNLYNTFNTLQTPMPKTFLQTMSITLWTFLHRFRSFQFKYALKTSLAAMICLAPAFVDSTRPYFVTYRGEWALIGMLLIMVPTVGGTNAIGFFRIVGTWVGCYVGVVVYILFPAHPVMIPVCCLLFAIPNFYLVICTKYPRIGQVTLLAFNLVLIQSYNRRGEDGTLPPDEDDDGPDADDNGEAGIPELAVFRNITRMAMVALNNSSDVNGRYGYTNPMLVNNDKAGNPVTDAVWDIAYHRAVAVSFGVLMGVAVTSYVWPYEARVELRKGLSDLLVNTSWLYNRLVSVYSAKKIETGPGQADLLQHGAHMSGKPNWPGPQSNVSSLAHPVTQPRPPIPRPILKSNSTQSFLLPQPRNDTSMTIDIVAMNKEFMDIELALQLQLLQLHVLLQETPNEPRLKGAFPVETYRNMLDSCQNILDRFLSMRLVITKDHWLESARRDFIIPVNKERREMVGNVFLYFYTIASAIRLKTPLPAYLPPANQARVRLLEKIRQLPVVVNLNKQAVKRRARRMKKAQQQQSFHGQDQSGPGVADDLYAHGYNSSDEDKDYDERYISYYAYAVMMDDVIKELEQLGRMSQELFGVITPADEFEAWFQDDNGNAPV